MKRSEETIVTLTTKNEKLKYECCTYLNINNIFYFIRKSIYSFRKRSIIQIKPSAFHKNIEKVLHQKPNLVI